MKPSTDAWLENAYPLVDAHLSRKDCVTILENNGVPIPSKSACIFCPYHDDFYWQDLKRNHPDVFAEAVRFDRDFRDMSQTGVDSPVYLHRSLQPLDQVDFAERIRKRTALPMFDSFTEECEGMCGV